MSIAFRLIYYISCRIHKDGLGLELFKQILLYNRTSTNDYSGKPFVNCLAVERFTLYV